MKRIEYEKTDPLPGRIAPKIVRQRVLIEGFYSRRVTKLVVENFPGFITDALRLKSCGPAVVHTVMLGHDGQGSRGYDAILPLIDAGLYLTVWNNKRYMSLIVYASRDFNQQQMCSLTVEYFGLEEFEIKTF